ncbi:hypothetical protein SSTU70S_06314 [Stutzerimonas stutzeri]
MDAAAVAQQDQMHVKKADQLYTNQGTIQVNGAR